MQRGQWCSRGRLDARSAALVGQQSGTADPDRRSCGEDSHARTASTALAALRPASGGRNDAAIGEAGPRLGGGVADPARCGRQRAGKRPRWARHGHRHAVELLRRLGIRRARALCGRALSSVRLLPRDRRMETTVRPQREKARFFRTSLNRFSGEKRRLSFFSSLLINYSATSAFFLLVIIINAMETSSNFRLGLPLQAYAHAPSSYLQIRYGNITWSKLRSPYGQLRMYNNLF